MRYAVVTGASKGIGKAIASRLLSEGFTIAICARDAAKMKETVEEFKSDFPDTVVHSFSADLGIESDVNAFADFISANLPTVDILVNNAGIYQPGLLASEPEGQLEKMIQVNLYSAYWLTRRLLPDMKKQKSGYIFNMCSIASLRAYANGGAYSISKYALLGFTENLREELREYNIKVTAICPGATWSPSWEGSGIDPERVMEANDIADMLWASYSLSPRAVSETIVLRPIKGDL